MAESSWQPVMSAAQRRRQRRLRSWWRHEGQSIAAALATLQHHSAPRGTEDGQGEEDHELHGHVPGASSSQGGRCAALLLRRRRATCLAPGQTGCLPCLDRRSGFCGTPWSSLPTACGSCRRSMLLGEVGSVLSPWEPLPPHARAGLVLEQAAGIHRDRARLDQARHRTAMEVMRWFCGPVRCAALTWAERLHCLADASVWGVPPAQGGKEILGRMKRDPVLQVMERIQEQGTVEPSVVDVRVLMQQQFQQFFVWQIQFTDTVFACSCATETGTHRARCAEYR